MHYDRHYSGTPEEIDAAAIEDIREYLSPKQWDTMMQLVDEPSTTINHINMAFGFAGVSGRPFHAFCRKYMLGKYRKWMASDPDPIQTDEQGFGIKEEV